MASSGGFKPVDGSGEGVVEGTSSSAKRVRLAEVEPSARRLIPCEEGLATSELERRKSSRPGSWRAGRSSVGAAVVLRGLFSEEARGDGAFERAERGAVGGDRYLLGVGGGLEAEDGAVGDLHGLVRETRSGDAGRGRERSRRRSGGRKNRCGEELSGGSATVAPGSAEPRLSSTVAVRVVAGGVTGFVRGGSPRPTTPRSAPARQTFVST